MGKPVKNTSSSKKRDKLSSGDQKDVDLEERHHHSLGSDVKNLIRKPLHHLYPNDQLEEVNDDESISKPNSPCKNVSDSGSDTSPLRRRKEDEESIDADCTSDSSVLLESTPKITKRQRSRSLITYVIGTLVLLLLGYCWICIFSAFRSSGARLDVPKIMGELKSKYDGQPRMTFRIIERSIKRTVSSDSQTPGIIILLASREARDICRSFALNLAESISSSGYVRINSALTDAPASFKKRIDNTISSNLTEGEVKAVLVSDLDRIPFEAAMIFHSYCDHENAPFKKAIYVMTVSSHESIPPDSNQKLWDMLASERLSAAWGTSGEDQVSSLISRLTVSVAAVVSNA